MRYRKTVVLLTVLLMIFSFNSFAKPKKITRVNVAPLLKVPKGGISSTDQLKSLVEEYSERIKAGFEKAGAAELFPAFMDQIKSAEITEKELPKGQEFKWMLFYSAKKSKVLTPVVWAGKKLLPVYTLAVQFKCKDYHFVIPKACGNISLVDDVFSKAVCDIKVSPTKANIGDTITVDLSGSKCAQTLEVTVLHENKQIDFKKVSGDNPLWKTVFKIPGNYVLKVKALNAAGEASPQECSGEVYINYPPECELKVTPQSSYTGLPFKFDASGSSDKDGKVVKADFTVTNSQDGSEVDKKSVTDSPLVWDKVFKKSGKYDVSLVVTDDFNATSNNKCTASIAVQKRLYFLLEAGPGIAKGTYSMYAFGRLGLAYLLIPEKLSFVASAGAAFTLAGDPFKHHFLSNFLLNGHFGNVYIGAGLGYSTKVREPDWDAGLDIVTNLGFDIYSAFNKKASIFGELRIPMRSDLEFKHAHQILVGFRYLF